MNSSVYRFSLDIRSAQSQVSLPVLLGDTSRTLCISLSDGGSPYIIEDGCMAKLTIKRPTGTRIEEFCKIENKTTIVYNFENNENTASVIGTHECDLTLYDVTNKRITSPRFTMVVSDRVLNFDDIGLEDVNRTQYDAIYNEEAARQFAEQGRVKAEEGRVATEEQRKIELQKAVEAADRAASDARESLAKYLGDLDLVQSLGDDPYLAISQDAVTKEFKQTLNTRKEVTFGMHMDDLTEFGIYGWTASCIPLGCPVKDDAGIAVVFQFSPYNIPEYGRLVQTVYTTEKTFVRYRSTTGWEKWQEQFVDTPRYEATRDMSMDDLTNVGIYGWTYTTRPYDCPIADAGIAVIYQYSTSNNPNHGRLVQTVYAPKKTMIRYRTTTGWEEWQDYSTDTPRYTATADMSMDDLTNFGIYGWTASTVPYDCPIQGETGTLTVTQFSRANVPEYGRLVQVLNTPHGDFYRYRGTQSWSDWQCDAYTNTLESRKISASAKKCSTAFTPLANVKTSSSATKEFVAGKEYKGVPYSAVHFFAHDCLFNFNLETLFSLYNNPDSIIYNYENPFKNAIKDFEKDEKRDGNVYTGAVCSSFVSWVLNLPIFYTTLDIDEMLEYKEINDVEDVEVGDVLYTEGHVMVVSNILTGINGVTSIEISEMWIPLFRRVMYTPSRFLGLLEGTTRSGEVYKVGRFPNQGKMRTIPPLTINTDIITEYGDNTYFELGDDVYIQSYNNTIKVKSPSGVEQEVYTWGFNDNKYGKTVMHNIKSLLNEVGTWSLYGKKLNCEVVDGDAKKTPVYVNGKTVEEISHITIIQKGTATLVDNILELRGYKGCKPCGYNVMTLIPTDGSVDIDEKSLSNIFPAPEGYVARRKTINPDITPLYSDGIYDSDRLTDNVTEEEYYQIEFDFNTELAKEGFPYCYIRVYYDTGCGQAYQDTNIEPIKPYQKPGT